MVWHFQQEYHLIFATEYALHLNFGYLELQLIKRVEWIMHSRAHHDQNSMSWFFELGQGVDE
mgnify:CR=1 FL=1